jgi:hypothetical protein
MTDEGQQPDHPKHNPYTLEDAREAAGRDELGPWVAEFLASPGSDNADLARLLEERVRCWIGPVLLPFDQLHRLAGPPGDPVLVEWDEDDWRDDVEDLSEKVEEGWQPPPLVVTQNDQGQLVLEDGNHRVEGLRRTGEHETWAVVGFASEAARDRFLEASARVDG